MLVYIEARKVRTMTFLGPNHSVVMGYILWFCGFTGAHRFYFGRPISGTVYFCTFGLFGIGWLVDLFLIPGMNEKCDVKYTAGRIDYNISWLLLSFFGVLGIHRFYMGKWISGLIYLLTGGLFLMGYIYDYWTWNTQVSEING